MSAGEVVAPSDRSCLPRQVDGDDARVCGGLIREKGQMEIVTTVADQKGCRRKSVACWKSSEMADLMCICRIED